MSTFRFTPYSIEAFKRIARDVHRAYPLTLQQSQEALARAFGYVDLHALQEHLKTNPKPGAQGEGADFAAITVDGRFLQLVHELHGPQPLMPKGRRTFPDLCATWDPDRRRLAMDFEDEIDRIIEGDFPPEVDTPTSDYVMFNEQRLDIIGLSDTPKREGMFVVSPKGDIARHALRWIEAAIAGAADRRDEAAHERQFLRLGELLKLMPNNPYVLAAWLNFTRFSILDGEGHIPPADKRTVEYIDEVSLIWSLAKDCRAMFDELMPSDFRGQIVPNLVGIRVENEAYFNVLCVGALAAMALGHTAHTMDWARRSLKLDPTDCASASAILAMAEETQAS